MVEVCEYPDSIKLQTFLLILLAIYPVMRVFPVMHVRTSCNYSLIFQEDLTAKRSLYGVTCHCN